MEEIEARVGGHPEDRFVRGPVGWLAGPELVAKLGKILRRRSNPRGWMPYHKGALHDECWARNGQLVGVARAGGPGHGAERIVDIAPAPEDGRANHDCWFDYLADAGDASDSMYAIAYATMTSLRRRTAGCETWDRNRVQEALTPIDATDPMSAEVLPAGQFVFIGGDTAYHVADAPTLRSRMLEPFRWAFEDAKQNGHVAAQAEPEQRIRRLYGIPGNHDWYDNLEGFSRVFRVGTPPVESSTPWRPDDQAIELPLLEPVQLASYVAIQLPHGWQLWGLDIDSSLDQRQRQYFLSLGVPERLILVTPSPAIAFGARQPKPSHRDALDALGLPLQPAPRTKRPGCRIDLSGDIHHYARYFPRAEAGPAQSNYGSIVSGLGGAFHHPSFTRLDGPRPEQRVEPERLYPPEDRSRAVVAENLLNAKAALFGSWIRLFPMLFTVVFGLVGQYCVGGARILDHLFALLPGCTRPDRPDAGAALADTIGAVIVLAVAGILIGLAIRWGREIYKQQAEGHQPTTLIDLCKNRWRQPRRLRRVNRTRSYKGPWALGFAALALLVLYPLSLGERHTTALDVVTLIIVIAVPGGFTLVAWVYGGAGLRWPRRAAIAVAGLALGVAQVLTPIVLARLFATSWKTAIATCLIVVLVVLSPRLGRPAFRSARRGAALVIAVLALLVFAVSLGAVIAVAAIDQPGPVIARSLWEWSLLYGIAGAAAMPLGTIWFTWYLAVVGRLDGHNNEVGGAARVTAFRQLIRFHVHEGGLTGYVIAVENRDRRIAATCGGANLSFQLIDVFTIPAPGPAASSRGTSFSAPFRRRP